MRDPKRIPEILKLLEREWLKYPDLRFFQFVDALKLKLPNEISGLSRDFFYTEDDNLIDVLTDEEIGFNYGY